MRKWGVFKFLTVLLVSGTVLATVPSLAKANECIEPSWSFQSYCGYQGSHYETYLRTSTYVSMADGRRIAVDILRPSIDGKAVPGPLPVLFTYTVYGRAVQLVRDYKVVDATILPLRWWERSFLWMSSLSSDGNLIVDQSELFPWIRGLINRGYIVVAADAGGTGGSFGQSHLHIDDYGREAAELMDWIVAQPWSDGNIGMYGESFVSMTAYAAVAQRHPALKAIFVSAPPFDSYRDAGYPGGIYAKGFGDSYIALTSDLHHMAVAVDGDNGRQLLAAAHKEQALRSFGSIIEDLFTTAPHTDSLGQKTKAGWNDLAGVPLLGRVKQSEVAIYNIGGWRDIFSRDTTLWHENIKGIKHLTLRPWHHVPLIQKQFDFDPGIAAARWFDRWLKGIANNSDKDLEVSYFQLDGDASGNWCEAQTWPPEHSSSKQLYLGLKGKLVGQNPSDNIKRKMPVSALATSGVNSRWNGVLGTGVYEDMASNDRLGLSFTTEPLKHDMELAGHPVLRLWLSSQRDDTAVFAYLEELDIDGSVRYLSEGMLRAAYRKVVTAPYKNFDLPWHDYSEQAYESMPYGEPVLLEFDILPVAAKIRSGNSLRLTLQSGDADNFTPLPLAPSVEHSSLLHSGGDYTSSLSLPIASCASRS